MQATMLVGLLQPQPETYDLFDEVVLLSCGKVRRGKGGRGAVLMDLSLQSEKKGGSIRNTGHGAGVAPWVHMEAGC